MLQKVKNMWIHGLLKDMLHGNIRLELDLDYRPKDIDNSSPISLRKLPSRPQRLTPGTKLLDIFVERGDSLTILGGPGSGKTFILLELACDLLSVAEAVPHESIPIVLNLSSWGKERKSLQEWLADELLFTYGISKRYSPQWIESEPFILLLYGLDEVKPEHQEACVKSINQFVQDYSLTNIVVCSRTQDYERLGTPLHSAGLILIQPLISEQVDEYLADERMELLAVKATLQRDPILRKLATSPLMLSIMSQAYRGLSFDELQPLETVAARRHHLLASYVERMLAHRPPSFRYTHTQALEWLGWLASQMLKFNQSVFFVESLQPTWLPIEKYRQQYENNLIRIILLLGILLGMQTGYLLFGREGTILGAVLGFVWSSWVHNTEIQLVEIISWSPINISKLVKTVARLITKGLTNGLVWGAIFGSAYALSLWFFRDLDVDLTEHILTGLVSGSFIGIIFGPLAGLLVGMTRTLLGIMEFKEIERKTQPNQGVWSSFQNGLLIWIVVGIASSLSVILFVAVFELLLVDNMIIGVGNQQRSLLTVGVIVSLIIALGIGLNNGGRVVIQHFCLRYILASKGYMPLRLISFLDDMVACILLRRVGGGYIFLHRILKEYFAELETDE